MPLTFHSRGETLCRTPMILLLVWVRSWSKLMGKGPF